MLADRAQSRRQVEPLEPLERFLVKIAPEGAVVQCHGMGNYRDERHGGNPAVSGITKKHIEVCVRVDEGRYFVGLHTAADKTPRAKPFRPRFDTRHRPKRWSAHVYEKRP